MAAASAVKGFLFVLALFISSLLGAVVLMGPTTLLLFISRRAYRAWNQVVAKMWFQLACFLIETMFGVQFVFYGDSCKPGEHAIFMSNHNCRLDWLFLWSLFMRAGRLRALKIILKAQLKKVPGFGWAMQQFLFIFLRRNWDEDEIYMKRLLRLVVDEQDPLCLLIFPEGTDLSPSNLEKSHNYAKANGLQLYEHVLHPKVTGFECCLKSLASYCTAVYDVRALKPGLAFLAASCYQFVSGNRMPGGMRPSEKKMIQGVMPHRVHFHLQRFDLAKIQPRDHAVKQWLTTRFEEKERRLAAFSKTKSFGTINAGWDSNLTATFGMTALFWATTTTAFVVAFPLWPLWLVIAATLAYLTNNGGIDILELNRYGRSLKKEK